MKTIIILIFAALVSMNFSTLPLKRHVILDEFFSEFLSLNLIHAMQSANILYHLSKEPAFSKDVLETELDRIDDNVHYANDQISRMVEHASDTNKVKVSKYLKNIDEHLASVFLDIKTIRKDLVKKEDIAPFLSDIYYQLKKAEYQDHKEIKRILKFKIYNEPVIVQN